MTLPAITQHLARRLKAQGGFTMIELLVSLTVLTIGILGLMMGFDTSRKLSLVSERHATMAHVAQREIELLEGISYSKIGLTSAPGPSTDPANPDYYVSSGSPPSFQWDRTAGSTESLDVDTTSGTVAHIQSWSENNLSGQIYDFVTWATDPKCSPGCPSSQDYKRITVAVTVGGGLQPTPVWVSSIIADPQATPIGGISNGNTGNPIKDPGTKCTNASGQVVPCTQQINSGDPNTYYLHDWSTTNSGSVQPPSASHVTHWTVGLIPGQVCTTVQALTGIQSNIAGCPVPDLMDANAPGGTTLYNYSTDQGTSGYPGGRLLQPSCLTGLCIGGIGGGTGSPGDCDTGTWSSTLLNWQSEFWVTAPLTATTTLTGDGGLSLFTQTQSGTQTVVSFCLAIYDVPPNGSAGSLKDLLAWPPVDLGGVSYVPPTDPVTTGNWPTAASQLAFTFNFRGANGAVSIPTGDRIGFRIWMKATSNTAINLLYDNVLYPSQLQLNTQ